MRTAAVVSSCILVSCAGSSPNEPVARVAPSVPPTSTPAVGRETENKEPSAMPTTKEPASPATFDEDVAFLGKHGKVIVLVDPDGGRVALSPDYQGRVMTSGVAGSGKSLGWINRAFIEARKTGTPFDNYGGEDRFWLGPEAGQFGLYFAPGKPFTFANWQVPNPMQVGAWTVAAEKPDQVVFERKMTVESWSKIPYDVDVERTARLVGREDAKKLLGLASLPAKDALGFVAFETKNTITNASRNAWKRETGAPSIWILGMFAPAADARVVIPFEKNAPKGAEIVNDRYFGKIPAERLRIHEERGFLTLTCDGKERGKIGLGPGRAKNVLGSYSAEAKLLTIVQYDGPKKGASYVNSMWEQQKEPFKGDVVNSYNDGPTEPGKPALGGFYEIETSSPAAIADAKGSSKVTHTHRTFHFVGEPAVLEPILEKVLGVTVAEIMK